MNAVPVWCPRALNLHQKRPSSVTSGCLLHRAIRREIAAPSSVLMGDGAAKLPRHPSFHRAMQHETAAPSFVLMGDGAAKLPPSSAIPPRHATRNCSTIIRFDGDGAAKLPPSSAIPPRHTTRNRNTIIRFDGDGARKLPLGGCTFFHSSRLFPVFGNSVVRRGSRLRVAFACIVGENSVKEKWTIDDFRHP